MTLSNQIPEHYVPGKSMEIAKERATSLKYWDLTPRQICDLELIMNGGFNPLQGFLGEEDYINVIENMRLSNGALWPIPITLDVSKKFAAEIEKGQDIALRDLEGVVLAILTISDKWSPNKKYEAENVFGTNDIKHPAVNYLFNIAGPYYLGGQVLGVQKPVHYDFRARRNTPNELRTYFQKLGWKKIVAFQTRNPP